MGLWRLARLQHCETLWLVGTDFGFTKLSHLSAHIVKFFVTLKYKNKQQQQQRKKILKDNQKSRKQKAGLPHLNPTEKSVASLCEDLHEIWVVRRNVPQA